MARTREPRSDRESAPPDPTSGPVRTCVGCRSRGSASDLLRVVAVDGVLEPDPRRRLPGRGAWVHHDPGCLHRAERRSAFPRALRVTGPLDTGALRALLDPELRPVPSEKMTGTANAVLVPENRSTPHEPAVKHSR